jgi:hypothetical protein
MSSNKLAPKIGFIISILLFIFALGLYFHFPSAQEQWIWPVKTSALGFSFVGAWFAGGVSPLIYSGLFRQLSPLRALAFAGLVSTGGSAYFLYSKHDIVGNERYLPFSILFALGFLVIIYIFIKSNRGYLRDDNSVSTVIRWAFLLFSILLFLSGLGLVQNRPNIFPIALAPDMQDIYGWFFLGSAAYFFYGFLKPSRYNVTGQMISFLVYDLLLIPPYLKYTADVPTGLQTSLIIYLSVLFISAIFCLYYLFFDYRTRMFR